MQSHLLSFCFGLFDHSFPLWQIHHPIPWNTQSHLRSLHLIACCRKIKCTIHAILDFGAAVVGPPSQCDVGSWRGFQPIGQSFIFSEKNSLKTHVSLPTQPKFCLSVFGHWATGAHARCCCAHAAAERFSDGTASATRCSYA